MGTPHHPDRGDHHPDVAAKTTPVPADIDVAEEKPKQAHGIWIYQEKAGVCYNHIYMQVLVASIIGANFLTNIVEKEIDPRKNFYPDTWAKFELFYNVVFTMELLLNMYSSWFKAFVTDAWNVFDFAVVAIGLLDTAKVALPGPMKMLRMMRAFRVFRLFKKVKSLNKIVVSLVHAIPGMTNAFFINTLFMCIYAVLAVDFFGLSQEVLKACDNYYGTTAETGRELCWAHEYFASFGRSFYTLFQVLTGDSWSEAVVRPLFMFFDSAVDQFASGVFFVTFILLNSVVLLNVVVAVLLDKMAPSDDADEELPAHPTIAQKLHEKHHPHSLNHHHLHADHHHHSGKDEFDCGADGSPNGHDDLNNGSVISGMLCEKTPRSELDQLRLEVKELASDMRVRLTASRGSIESLTHDLSRCMTLMENFQQSRSHKLCM